MRTSSLAWAMVVVLGGCGGDDDDRPDASEADGGRDAGTDAGRDAGMDAGRDGGMDAGSDAGPDAGPDAGMPDVVLPMPCEPGSVAHYVISRLHVAQEDPAGAEG